jgi:hypothetical protein
VKGWMSNWLNVLLIGCMRDWVGCESLCDSLGERLSGRLGES